MEENLITIKFKSYFYFRFLFINILLNWKQPYNKPTKKIMMPKDLIGIIHSLGRISKKLIAKADIHKTNNIIPIIPDDLNSSGVNLEIFCMGQPHFRQNGLNLLSLVALSLLATTNNSSISLLPQFGHCDSGISCKN